MNRLLAALLVGALGVLGVLGAGEATAQLKIPGIPGIPGISGLGGDDLLAPEKAFRFTASSPDTRSIEVQYVIADGYYLYRDRFKFQLEAASGAKLGAPQLPPGARKTDQFFGEVETYRKQVRIRLPVDVSADSAQVLNLIVTSQGCADIGVCYTPMESRASVRLAALESIESPAAPVAASVSSRFSGSASDFDIAALFQGNLAVVLASFVGFGLLLAFTPCMLPMIPILSGIILGEGADLNRLRAFVLSLAYVLGMALAYALAGVAAAYSGSLLAAALQNAWVLGAFSLVFVVLALSMFGLYDLKLPAFVHHRAHRAHQQLRGGRVVSVAAMGMLSAIIVSPCVAAPLAGALLYISRTGDVVLGGAALFAMAIGMGIPLIIVGVSEGALIPRSGSWLVTVRKFFGVLLLGVAIWIASPVIPVALQMGLWAVLLVGSGIFLRALDGLPANAPARLRLGKALGVLSLLIGVAMLAGALSGARDPLRPLAGLVSGGAPERSLNWVALNSVAELEAQLKAPGRPVMLDFYADWCVSCKEMESFTFSYPGVREKLGTMLLLRADVTANSDEHKRLLKRFSLFGPPGTIFFDGQGKEIRNVRVIGFQSADKFMVTLERIQSAI